MNEVLLTLGSLFAGIAAVIHVYIWALESLLWSRDSSRRVFGVRSPEDAETLRPWVYNQGFYNLFLAIGVAAGLVLTMSGLREAGVAITLFACVSMLLASIVLVTSNARMSRAALVQGLAPLLAVVGLGLGSLG